MDLKSYTRENRADWLNKVIDWAKVIAFGALFYGTIYIWLMVASIYDM